jgi:hypothetical protein
MKYHEQFNKDGYDYEVGMDESEGLGWFEVCGATECNEEEHAEGGIWFDGKEITDYDGVFEMPQPIIDWLENKAFDVDYF